MRVRHWFGVSCVLALFAIGMSLYGFVPMHPDVTCTQSEQYKTSEVYEVQKHTSETLVLEVEPDVGLKDMHSKNAYMDQRASSNVDTVNDLHAVLQSMLDKMHTEGLDQAKLQSFISDMSRAANRSEKLRALLVSLYLETRLNLEEGLDSESANLALSIMLRSDDATNMLTNVAEQLSHTLTAASYSNFLEILSYGAEMTTPVQNGVQAIVQQSADPAHVIQVLATVPPHALNDSTRLAAQQTLDNLLDQKRSAPNITAQAFERRLTITAYEHRKALVEKAFVQQNEGAVLVAISAIANGIAPYDSQTKEWLFIIATDPAHPHTSLAKQTLLQKDIFSEQEQFLLMHP